METLIFLSSGLFLGWSLGANDAANIFGTAVGSRMLRFGTAAAIASLFVIVGAVLGGAATTDGLGQLGEVDALPGAFTVALSAAVSVWWMTKAGLPVSTSQAIVGAIVGWNVFCHRETDYAILSRIVSAWIAAPILGAVFAAVLHAVIRGVIRISRLHMLRLDQYTRWALVVAGAFGAFSLGANNIANVMGVFVPASPFTDATLAGVTVSSAEKLFLIGGVAIAIGIITFSKRVMMTISRDLLAVSPVGAFSVVVAQGLVLLTFTSRGLSDWFVSRGLPAIPQVPISSSQAVVGAVIGLALLRGLRGMRQVRWGLLAHIAGGWVTTPVAAGVLCYVALFVLRNVFLQQVHL